MLSTHYKTANMDNGLNRISHFNVEKEKTELDPCIQTEVNEDVHSWRVILRNYTQETTFHGVRFITGDTVFIIRRVIWGILVLTAIGIFLANMINRLEYYFSYQKTINVEVEYLDKIEFPAVTICNENQYKLSTVTSNGWYKFLQDNILFTANGTAPGQSCSGNSRRCGSGECMDVNLWCDSFRDCGDGSDEAKCGPCKELHITGLTGELLRTIGATYRLQNVKNGVPTYRKLGGSIYLYHLQDKNVWWFGSNVSSNGGYIHTSTAGRYPQDALQWLTSDNRNVYMKLTCNVLTIAKYRETNTDHDVININTRDFREKASHHIGDMLEECTWKGEPCGVDNFTAVHTESGLCYSFTPRDEYVSDIGPTNGLSFVLNAETYDYIKNSKGGLGIKIELHSRKDIPSVQEHGFSLTPGLYTLIALEKTEITNLEPNWGKCGVKELSNFVDYYTMAKCKMDQQINYVEHYCGCREFHMPKIQDGKSRCTVEQYLKCSRSVMETFRREGKKPECPEECKKATYLPTISFSALSPNNFPIEGDSIGEKVSNLKQNLVRSRELTYRVDPERVSTLFRILQTLKQKLASVITLLSQINGHLETESLFINSRLSDLRSDCFWLSGIQTNITRFLEHDLSHKFENFLSTVFSNVYVLLKQSHSSGESTRSYTSSITDQNSAFRATDWGKMSTFYDATQEALLILSSLSSNLTKHLSAYPTELGLYHLREGVINQLSKYIHSSSSAVGISRGSLVKDITSSVAHKFSSLFGPSVIHEMRRSLTVEDLRGRDFNGVYQYIRRFETRAGERAELVKSNYDALVSVVEQYLHAPAILVQELRNTLTPICGFKGSELSATMDRYNDIQYKSSKMLRSFNKYITDKEFAFTKLLSNYEKGVIQLQTVADTMDWASVRRTVESNTAVLRHLLDERVVAIGRVQNVTNLVNFWLAAQASDSTLAKRSAYWRNMKINNMVLSVDRGTTPPMLRASPPDAVTRLWVKTQRDVRVLLKKDITDVFSELDTAFSTFEKFLDTFAAGNKINADFYKNNFLQLSVYYKEISTKKVVQQKAYEYQTLLGEVGGLMGLLLGGSVLTILEIFDLCIYNYCRKLFHKRRETIDKKQCEV